MKDPTALIHHIYKKFNEMNIHYLGQYNRVPDVDKETDLRRLGKTAVNLDFFHLVCSESRVPLHWSPLQNPYFNWFDHDRDDQHGRTRDKSCVYIPSEYYNFQNLKEPVAFHNNPNHEKLLQCSIVIDNPHPHVVDSLLSTFSVICRHQKIVNLCLFWLNIRSSTIDNVFTLSPSAQNIVLENCAVPHQMIASCLNQIQYCPNLKGIRLQNNTFQEPEYLSSCLSDAMQKWGMKLNWNIWLF